MHMVPWSSLSGSVTAIAFCFGLIGPKDSLEVEHFQSTIPSATNLLHGYTTCPVAVHAKGKKKMLGWHGCCPLSLGCALGMFERYPRDFNSSWCSGCQGAGTIYREFFRTSGSSNPLRQQYSWISRFNPIAMYGCHPLSEFVA